MGFSNSYEFDVINLLDEAAKLSQEFGWTEERFSEEASECFKDMAFEKENSE